MLSPIIVGLVYVDTQGSRIGMVAVVSIIWLSDIVDGRVARRSGTASRRGAVLDPIADDVAICAGFLALLALDIVPLWFVALALWSRSAVVLIRLLRAVRGDDYAAPLWSTKGKGIAFGVGQVMLFSLHLLDNTASWVYRDVFVYVIVGAMTCAVAVAMAHFVVFTHGAAVLDVFRSAQDEDRL